MNYYNPYFYTMPNIASTPKVGLFSRLLGGRNITLSGIFNGTQRVLNFANQAIPLVKQVRPMIGNAKTMFKVMNEFKRVDAPKNTKKISNASKNTQNTIQQTNPTNEQNTNGPTFFM